MQTILGANGVIATELAKALLKYTDKIRLVSRNPKKVNKTDELFPADLLDPEKTAQAIKGSDVVYLTAGLTYNSKIWREQWPVIMKNVIDGCKKQNAKLVFFDNVYCYGRVNGWMTEETPMNPLSEKGKVRQQIAGMILEEVKKGTLTALIARAPDFYGPNTPLSFINVMIFENLKKGKKAQLLVSDKFRHSLIYTPDAGKATAILGNTESAFNQVWHLPSDLEALTGKELADKAAVQFGVKPGYMVLSKFMIRLVGIFMPVIRESVEMLYQNDSNYLFDSSKFNKAFDFRTTLYDEGIAETAKSMK
ncbi:MAG: NAD-dependent epimerase/dehydratase family protein [Bacteroidota bacterium]